MKKLKLMVVDDHPIFLKGLVDILQEELPNADIYSYKSSKMALQNADLVLPNLAILDLDMPEINGITLCEELKKVVLNLKVIILTMHKEPDIIRSVIAKGIEGFVFKDDAVNEITQAIQQVLEGNIYVSNPTILHQNDEKSEFLSTLTKTECLVLKQIASNKTSKEIAESLFISSKTVENHRNNISRKLQIKGSNSLIKFAINNQKYF